MPEYTQQYRRVAVGSPLGDDVLLFKSMNGTEQLSRLFHYNLTLLSEEQKINFADIVGQNMTVRLELPDDKTRYFNGYVSRFVQTRVEGDLAEYQATIVPWLWFLTRTADCRIFQKKTVPEIIKKVFEDAGFAVLDDSLSPGYRTWGYCVQYRETDFNFVSRLMEQEGIYYFFEHANGKHTLVLADSLSAHETFLDYKEIPYRPAGSTSQIEHIGGWNLEQAIQPGVYALNDYDFEKPQKDLLARSIIQRDHAAADFEIFDYPGEYTENADGDSYAKLRIQELQASHEIVSSESDAQGICCGYTFKVTDHPREDQEREYLVMSTTIHVESDSYDSAAGGGGGGGPLFQCQFSAMDSSQPFRPPRVTPKPVIQGPQTAVVVGKDGEEIWTDEHGRVKLQFHWDRYGKADENSSCWIRVSHLWAGKNWGSIYLPRIGQEVIVEFLEGDPDRPIVTGRVYNGQAPPPYKLPDSQTMSTIKSNSTKGGGGFNEIRFEDKKGDEHIFIRAEKDQHNRVQNDAFELVGNDRHLIVTNNQLEQVDGDKHLTVKGDQNEKVDGTVSLDAGMDLQQKVGMNHALEAGMEVHIKGGMKVIVEAGTQLTMKVGGNFIDINPGGVFIKGTMVMINSGGAAGSGSGCSPDTAKLPDEAIEADPGSKDEPAKAPEPPEPVQVSSSAKVLAMAAEDGTPFCEKCEAARKTAAGEA